MLCYDAFIFKDEFQITYKNVLLALNIDGNKKY